MAGKGPTIADWLGRIASKAERVDLYEWRAGALGHHGPSWKPIAANAVEELAREMQEAAEIDGRGQALVRVGYVLIATRGDGEQVGPRYFFDVEGRAKDERSAGVESADERGVLAQMMKHNQDMARVMNEQSQVVLRFAQSRDEGWQRQLDLLSGELTDERKTRLEVQTLHQKLVLFTIEQERMRAELARQERRDEWLMEKLNDLLPMGINRLLGGGPGKGVPGVEGIVRRVFEKMRPEQIDQLMALFGPEDQALIAEIYMGFAAQKAQQAQARAKLNDANGTGGAPAADANGAANGKEHAS